MHEQLLVNASSDLEFYSTAIWRELRERSIRERREALIESLARIAQVKRRARQTHSHHRSFRRRRGLMAALSTTNMKLSEIFGEDGVAVDNAGKLGARRIVLRDGAPALEVTRKLPGPFGQLTIIHPLDSVLIEWAPSPNALLFNSRRQRRCSSPFSPPMRGRPQTTRAEEVSIQIRRRLETALSNGRAPLGLGHSAGRIYWSDSMHEILDGNGATLSSNRRTRRHAASGDGDLAHIAAMVLASKTKTVDHEFRIKNAAGEWIWLRARANSSRPRQPGAHLVGIAVDISDRRRREQTATPTCACARRSTRSPRLSCCGIRATGLSPATRNSRTERLSVMSRLQASYRNVMNFARAPLVEIEQERNELTAVNSRTLEVRLIDGRWLQINERRTPTAAMFRWAPTSPR